MKRVFQTFIADPAWSFGDNLKKMKRKTKRAASAQYKTMTEAQIIALPIKQLIDPNGSIIALWVPGSHLLAGLRVLEAWGFTYKQNFVWVKLKKNHKKEANANNYTRVGMGHLFRQSHEICLIGVAGKSIYKRLKNRGQRSVMFDLNVKHSRKPDLLHERLELMFPDAERLEIFARRERDGWTCLGDGIDGVDLNVSLAELVNPTFVETPPPEDDKVDA